MVNSLPANAKVLILFGEIDCREDEGIIKNYKKTDQDIDTSISQVVKDYTSYLSKVLEGKGLNVIIGGVPAPVIKHDVTVNDKELLIRVVKEFNLILSKEIVRKNYSFLDLYSLTRNQQGFANGVSHIDDHHLYPQVLKQALSELR